MMTVRARNVRTWASVAVAILLFTPVLQSGSNVVNIAYGRSWPRSIIIDSARQLVFVDGVSGEYPPDGFSFGLVTLTNSSLGKVLGLPGIGGDLALDVGTETVYAAGQTSVTVIDGLNMSIERTIAVKIPIFGMVFDSTTGHLLLTSGNSVFQLDPASGKLLRNATVGQAAEGMAVDPASGLFYVANYLSSSVSVLRTSDLSTVKTVQLPKQTYPSQLSLDTKRGVLFVTTDGQTVVKVSSSGFGVLGDLHISNSNSNGTYAIALDQIRDRIFVATEPGTTVTELNATTGAHLSSFAVAAAVVEMAVDQSTGKLYVTDYHQITAFTPTDVPNSGRQLSQPEVFALVAVAIAAAAASVYVWRFRPTGGMRGGHAPQPQRGRPSLP
jgi:DNA-binding beta-propeller fold protein YncE